MEELKGFGEFTMRNDDPAMKRMDFINVVRNEDIISFCGWRKMNYWLVFRVWILHRFVSRNISSGESLEDSLLFPDSGCEFASEEYSLYPIDRYPGILFPNTRNDRLQRNPLSISSLSATAQIFAK
jgi:hypothetical protein